MLRKLLLLIAISAVGCGGGGHRAGPPGGAMPTTRMQVGDEGQIVIYARQTQPIEPAISWVMRKVSAQRVDGSQYDLATGDIVLDTERLAVGQRLLLIAPIAPGDYEGITIFTDGAYLEPGDKPMRIETAIVNLDHSFSAAAGVSKTLILDFSHPATGGQPEPVFRPSIEIEDESPRPTARLVYVSNRASSNVSVIDKHLRRVIYNVYVGGRPSAIGVDNRRGRLYIAERRTGTIYEMDTMSQRLINVTELGYVDEPVDVLPVPEKDVIIVVNYGSDSVHLLDSFTMQPTSTIDVGRKPTKAIYSQVWELAFILNRQNGTVSVLNLEYTPVEPDTIIQVELNPSGMAINEADDWLYVSNEGSTDITVIKMETLAIERSLTVGTGVTDIAFDPFGRRLYIAFGYSREVKGIDPYTGVELFTVRVDSPPTELLFDQDEKKLYALLPESNAVVMIDPVAKSMEAVIETGGSPSGMALRL
jgi:YVTN family beta-propeller protein